MRIRWIPYLALIAAGASAGLVGGGCTDDTIAIEDFSLELERALCARAVACGGAADQATCESTVFVGESMASLTVVAAVKSGRIKYDAAKATTCVRTYGTDCADRRNDPDVCDSVFTGAVPPGGACGGAGECANDGRCAKLPTCTSACCMGTCETVARPAIGQSCSPVGVDCVDGAFCQNDTCVAELVNGSPCQGTGCASPAICLRSETGTTVTEICTVISTAEGAPCVPGANFGCGRQDETCSATMQKCVKTGKLGAACQASSDCVGYANCVAGACTMRPNVGQPCDFDQSLHCLGQLICPLGECANPPSQPACL